MKTFYVIDAYAQFFRAYHAIRTPMTSPVTGEPTNMTFGFVGGLLKLLRGDTPAMKAAGGRPDYVGVATDVSGDRGTFRSTIYPEYKATRKEPPEDLFPQVERCLAIMEAMRIPVIGSAGYEADDVIAAIVKRLRASDMRIRMISKDKDLKQLLTCDGDPLCVELYDLHTDVVCDAAVLMAETGLTPAQVIDMLALMGDTVDNVPGVAGIGPKTAAQLIAQYGSLDALVADAANIKGKRGENIRGGIALLPLSRELVTLRTDMDIDFDLARCDTSRFDLGALMPALKELGFNRYQDELRTLMGEATVMPLTAAPQTEQVEAKPARRSVAPSYDPGGLFASIDSQRAITAQDGEYRCVRTPEDMVELVRELKGAPAIALDTETTGLSPLRSSLVGMSFSTRPGTGWYVPVRSPDPAAHLGLEEALSALRPILEDPAVPKIGHNIKYDMIVLRNHGVMVRGLTTPGGCDTMIAAWLIDSSRSSLTLDALALALLGRTNISIAELLGSGREQRTFDTVPIAQATQYAAEDADVTLRLAEKLSPMLRAMGLEPLMYQVETPLVEVLAELEWTGVLLDPSELDRQRARLEGEMVRLHEELARTAKAALGWAFDPESPRQLEKALFNKDDDTPPGLGLKPGKRTKTGYSTDAEVLQKLADDATIDSPIPKLVLEYRQLAKLVSTYLRSLVDEINPKTKRVHSSFNQTGATTGRLSSSDPNLQNIPIRTDVGREIRRAFVAPQGRVLITADYSQIELRVLAHLSRDPALISAFERGEDIHRAVAAQVHGVPLDQVTKEQRSGAKMINFGIVYGITSFGLARRLGIENDAANEIIRSYKKRFAGISTFLEECIAQARRHGYVETMLKRRRPIPNIDARNPQDRAFAERIAINSVVQGSAADLIKLAMVDLHRRLSPGAAHWRGGQAPEIEGVSMLIQIHDELVFEAPEDKAEPTRDLIVDRMQRAMTLDVPLVVDAAISKNWFEGK